MANSIQNVLILAAALCLFSLVDTAFGIQPISEANSHGFTIDLIHRDSPESPIYDPLLTGPERVDNAYQRSLHRSREFASSTLTPNGGEYLVRMSFGTPPLEVFAIADTGSDTTWIQCLPCVSCFKSKIPPFDPKKSSTYQSILCKSAKCELLPLKEQGSCQSGKGCLYNSTYADGSVARGDLATETISFGSGVQKVSFPNFIFGCGHENTGIYTKMMSGVLGLGSRKLSLATQLRSSIDGKFSFCAGPSAQISKPGKLSFGADAAVAGPGVVSTSLIIDEFYYLILDAVSVENKRFQFPSTKETSKSGGGNIIIDSGTTYTFLPSQLYDKIEKEVKAYIKSNNTVKDPLGIFPLCYSSLRDDVVIPRIIFHFRGADVELKPMNSFVNTSPSSLCLAFVSTTDVAVFGNVAQMNYLVGYDVVRKTISFKRTDCTI